MLSYVYGFLLEKFFSNFNAEVPVSMFSDAITAPGSSVLNSVYNL